MPLRVLTDTPAGTSAVVELIWRGRGYTVSVSGSGELAVTLTAEGTEGVPSEASPDVRDRITHGLFVRLLVDDEEVAAGSMPVEVEGKTLQVLPPAAARADDELLDVVAGSVALNG